MYLRGSVLAVVFAIGLFLVKTPAAETPAAGTPADPLFQAIQKSDPAAIKRALDRGIDPNERNAEDTPALMAAVLYADAGCVKLLLDRGADPNAINKAGATALMWAMPDVAKAKLLIASGADVNARSKNLQRTALLVAASYPGSVAVLQLLLDHGADLHAKDRLGMHALGRAAVSADVDVVRYLVDRGCDPNEPGYGTTVRYARQYRPTLEYLLSKGARIEKDALAMSAHWQDPPLIEKWIERGADVNAEAGPYHRTALMTAAASEQAGAATVKLLLEKGANPNAEDIDGERPLDWAIYRADRDKIAALEKFGATRGHGPRQRTYPNPQAGGIADPRVSVERAVNLLLPAAPPAYLKRGCISCHSQALVAMAAAEARKKGIAINQEMEQTNLKQIEASYKVAGELAMQGDQPGGNIITIGYVMMALAAEKYPLNTITAELTHAAASLQMPDGSWTPNGVSRPPMEDTLVTATAMGVRSLTLYPLAGRHGQLEEKIRLAQRWLAAVNARSAEDRSMKLMGLVWAKASKSEVDGAVRQILGQQREGGGWAQRDDMEPDAYATGISLYALHVAGVSSTNDAYRNGVRFLERNQYQDGSWLVKTRSFPTQPYFESGYPFGNNQFISAGAASWAALAIAYTLPDAGK
ncbi:MAG TPA: ankyrin repeat domain-containing protein [Bryobacteraceae bacterium]|nr:ankyrin repeat domain-containing protein [Bryobacteraceae bacterium]